MKLNVLLSAVAAACLVLPASALADPPAGQNPAGGEKDHPQQAKGVEKGKPAAGAKKEHGEDRQGSGVKGPAPNVARGQAQQDKQRGGRSQTQSGATAPFLPRAQQAAPTAPVVHRPAPAAPSSTPQEGRRESPPQLQARPVARQAPPAALEDWRPPARGPARDQAGQQWRQAHEGLDRNAPWRQAPDWWRHDSGFRLYQGPRVGFFFVPQMGYITVPRQYRNHHWQAGEYLPPWFRRYTVRDYARYGLPRPPRGCIWVWLNGDVALIGRSDGYILYIIRNVW